MKVCVVGNGASALNNKNGKFIDTCDVVIRMKHFELDGYTDYVGSKTDIYSSRWFSWTDAFRNKPEKWKDIINGVSEYWFMFCDPYMSYTPDTQYVSNYIEYVFKNDVAEKNGNVSVHEKNISKFNLSIEKIKYMPYNVICELAGELNLPTDIIHDKYNNNGIIEPSAGVRTLAMALDRFEKNIYITGFDSFLNSSWYWDPNHPVNQSCHCYTREHLYIKKLLITNRICSLDI